MKFGKLAVLALAIVGGVAHADVTMNFESINAGCYVGSYYAGGTDSCGDYGPNYGITMSGRVQVGPNGNHYVVGGAMSFAARSDITQLKFDGVGPDPYGDYVMYAMNGNQMVDALWPGGVDAWIDESREWHFGSVFDAVHTYTWPLRDLTLTGFNMNLLYLDNVTFVSPTWLEDPVSVPLPGTLALLSVGALAMRRRKSA